MNVQYEINVQYEGFEGIPNDAVGKQLISLREQVFVKEQGLSDFVVVDDQDKESIQIYSFVNNDLLIGNCRARYIGEGTWKIERVCLDKKYRSNGIGKNMILYLEKEIKQREGRSIILASQKGSIDFYRNMGFQVEGELFNYFGVSHIMMRRNLYKENLYEEK